MAMVPIIDNCGKLHPHNARYGDKCREQLVVAATHGNYTGTSAIKNPVSSYVDCFFTAREEPRKPHLHHRISTVVATR